MTSLYHFLAPLAMIVVLGSGCASTNPIVYITTEHNSRVSVDGVDEALVGTWELDEMKVAGGAAKSPFFGSTMTYSFDGSLTQNFTTEQYDGGAVNYEDCQISGALMAQTYVDVDFIDSVDDDGNIIERSAATYLNIYDPTGGANVECPGPAGNVIATAHQSAELGTGPFASDSRGNHVPYYYELDPNWYILHLYLGEPDDGAYLAKYSFSRLTGPYPFE